MRPARSLHVHQPWGGGRRARAVRALQMELDPHFLFNVLNAIGGLVRQGEGRRAVDVISKLGDVLRRGLARDRAPEVTVEAEIAYLREFLELEQLRFDGELAFSVAVDPLLVAARVPVLILQPLVENAVRHGGSAGQRSLRIHVAAHRDNGVLRLSVGDSGLGFAADVVEGIGLSNTRRRLADLYGDGAGLRVGTSELGGALVEVFLPLESMPRSSREHAP